MPLYSVGDRLRLRKKHPCGSDVWEVMKAGVDTRIRCTGCQRVLLLPRDKLMKQIRSVEKE